MSLVSLLIALLVIGVVCYLIFWVMNTLGLPEPVRKVVTVVIVIVVILWILTNFLPSASPLWHWPR